LEVTEYSKLIYGLRGFANPNDDDTGGGGEGGDLETTPNY